MSCKNALNKPESLFSFKVNFRAILHEINRKNLIENPCELKLKSNWDHLSLEFTVCKYNQRISRYKIIILNTKGMDVITNKQQRQLSSPPTMNQPSIAETVFNCSNNNNIHQRTSNHHIKQTDQIQLAVENSGKFKGTLLSTTYEKRILVRRNIFQKRIKINRFCGI